MFTLNTNFLFPHQKIGRRKDDLSVIHEPELVFVANEIKEEHKKQGANIQRNLYYGS